MPDFSAIVERVQRLRSGQSLALQIGLVVLIVFAVYANSLGNGFVYDDHLQILDNPWLRDPRALYEIFTNEIWAFTQYSASDYYRPLMHTLNLALYSLFGPSRFFFHLASLLLHAGCSVLLLLVSREFLRNQAEKDSAAAGGLAFCTALLFAVHPANVEAVAWLGSSADLLYVWFCLFSLWAYLRAQVPAGGLQPGWYALSLGLFFGATLCKETAFLFPALFPVVDGARGLLASAKFRKLLLRCYCGYGAVIFLSLAIRFAALGTWKPVANTVTLQVWRLFQALSWYLDRLAWPFRHNFYPELPTLDQAGALVYFGLPVLILLLFTGLVWLLRKQRQLWLALVLVLVPLLPAVANFALNKPVAERYLYLPAMGCCLLLAWALSHGVRHTRWRLALLALMLTSFAGSTVARNFDFRNDLTLWKDTIAKSPYSAKASGWYATALLASGQAELGIAQTAAAIELGLKSSNNLLDLADALIQIGRDDEVAWYLNRVLEKNPGDAEAFFEIGLSWLELGDIPRAIAHMERSWQLNPRRPLTAVFLARALIAKGDYARAAQLFAEAIRLDPAALPALEPEISQVNAWLRKASR